MTSPTVERADPSLSFSLLGPVVAARGGRPLPIPGSRPRTVLAVLATAVNRVVPVVSLAEAMWDGEPGETAESTVQVYVFRLRKALAQGASDGRAVPVDRVGPGYRLHAVPGATDLEVHDRLRREAAAALAAGDAARAERAATAALDLWRGPALADLPGSRFVEDVAATWEEQRLAVAELRVDAGLALGRTGDLVPELVDLVAGHPLRESLTARLMVALYRAGRQADALAAFTALRGRLDDELGLEPGPELVALEGAVLRQDRQLDAGPPILPEGVHEDRTERAAIAPDPLAWLTVDDGEPMAVTHSPWTIGRSRDCDLVLTDSKVSRRHAQVVLSGDVAVVVDLGSTNGTRVDREAVTTRELQHGSVLGIGRHRVVFRAVSPSR